MYSTCIGLILKGYNDYENKYKQMAPNFVKIETTGIMQQQPVDETLLTPASQEPEKIKQRKTLKSFMDTFKNNLIEMFKEEEDTKL